MTIAQWAVCGFFVWQFLHVGMALVRPSISITLDGLIAGGCICMGVGAGLGWLWNW